MAPVRFLALFLVIVPGCASGDDSQNTFTGPPAITSATAAFGSTGSETSTDGSGSEGESGNSTGDATEASTGDSTTSDTDVPGTDATTGTSDGSSTTGPNPDGLPNGSECSSPSQCMSGNCFTLSLPVDGLPSGICGVCDQDQDCVDANLGTACSIDVMGMKTVCTNGGVGSFCESQAACADGLYCDELIEGLQGLLPMACGECRTDDDCPGNSRCTPSINVAQFSGNKYCAATGSVPNDNLCPLGANDVCASGHCGVVDVGFVQVGVCGACSSDSDCPGTCTPGSFSDGFVGSVCE